MCYLKGYLIISFGYIAKCQMKLFKVWSTLPHLFMCAFTTIISTLQGASRHRVHYQFFWLECEKNHMKIRHNFGGVITDKQNMETCVKHKGKCSCAVILENGTIQWIFCSQKVWTNHNSLHSIIFHAKDKQLSRG